MQLCRITLTVSKEEAIRMAGKPEDIARDRMKERLKKQADRLVDSSAFSKIDNTTSYTSFTMDFGINKREDTK